MTFSSFLTALFAVFICYALWKGVYVQPRQAKQREAVEDTLQHFRLYHLESFAAFVQEKHSEKYSLFLLKLTQLEAKLTADAKEGLLLVPFKGFGEYDDIYILYQVFMESTKK